MVSEDSRELLQEDGGVNKRHEDLKEHVLAAADPLCWHGATRARVANEYLLATERCLKSMPRYHFPFIVFHGADDTLTDPDGSRALYERSQVLTCAPPLAASLQLLTL